MVGIASQNENSAAERRSAPSSMAPTMVAPERDTPGTMARHCTTPMMKYIGSVNFVRVVIARLEVEPVDPQQHRAADDQREADDPDVEQHVLDEVVRERADHRRRQKRDQHADDEAPRRRIVEHAEQQLPQPREIDRQQRQDGAELDQHREGLAEILVVEAEEMR